LLVVGPVGDALAAFDEALALADLKNLVEMTTALREAIEKYGELPGVDEVMTRIETRRRALSQEQPSSDHGLSSQGPLGSP
jgi:hypothetical protein